MATNLIVNGHSKRLAVGEARKEPMQSAFESAFEPNVNENARKVLAARYLIKDQEGNIIETPGQLMARVARAIAAAETTPELRDQVELEFKQMLCRLEFLPNTPCLVNAGRPGGTGQYSACFVLPVPDSMEGIFEAVKQMALVHQTGGGTGFSFSRLRPKGDIVRTTSGVASGPISFMTPFNATTETTKQGGVRRGANMGVLRVDHPDILDFIRLKANDVNALQNFNVSVGITDAFMHALEADADYTLIHPNSGKGVKTLSARMVFNEIVQCAHTIGDPGLIFLDRVNALDPLTEVLGPIEATNPCVPAGTRILTSHGWQEIQTVVGQAVRVWNGEQWSTVTPAVTGHDQPIVKVTLSDGHSLRCTPRHAFYLADGTRVEARDLRPGDALEKLGFTPPVEGFGEFASEQVSYLGGFYQGDGYLNTEKNQLEINFYGADKIAIAKQLADDGLLRVQPYSETQDRVRGVLNVEVPMKGLVPININIRHALAWLAGLLDADGNVVANGTSSYGYQLSSISRPFLADVQLLLRRLGVPSTLSLMKEAETKIMPGGEYDCQPCWRITIAASAVCRLQEYGLPTRRLPTTANNPAREALRFPRVLAVEPDGVASTVYCFTEPQRHRGVFDGVLTGQCGEVPLRGHDACTLGSIDVSKFYNASFNDIDWGRLQDTVMTAVRFLDNVLTVNKYPVKEIYEVTGKSRKIGLGVMGWAELLIKLGVPYASGEAYDLAEQLMSFISTNAIRASEKLAEERGAFPVFDLSKHKRDGKKPRRNSTCTVIAPTGTISIIAGCSSGIEPLYALGMTRDQAGMKMIEINPLLEQVARKNGFWSEELKVHVAQTGSVQNAPGVPDKWKQILMIANEIPVEAHIEHQAAFQRHVEDGVSKTINMARQATMADVEDAYMLAWTSGCKGITVYRDGCRDGQVLTAGTSVPTIKSATITVSASAPAIQPATATGSRRRIPETGRRKGETFTRPTTFGSVHVTINEHSDDNEPFEMFVRIGKGGSEINAWTEAFGRTVSYLCSLPSSVPPTERLAALARQLSGIGGGEGVGFGPERVSSAADAISRIIGDYVEGKLVTNMKDTLAKLESSVRRDICPSCGQGTLTFEQKCGLCSNCGFSKCS